MTMFEKIIKAIFGKIEEELILPDAMVFKSLDHNKISVKLDIETKAISNGKLNLPESDSLSLDATEEEIQAEVMRIVGGNLQNYDTQQSAYTHRISSLDPIGLSAKCRGEASFQLNTLRSKMKQESGALYTIKQSLVGIEKDWQNFKNQWGIKSDPNFGVSKSGKFGLLALMILIETVINGALIGPYAEGGPLEGGLIAFMFPVLTLLFCAYPAGNLIRRLFISGTTYKKILFFLIVASLCIFATIMNLFLAYIREAVFSGMEWHQGLDLLIQTLTGNAYPIGAPGVLIFLLSMGLYVAAVFDVFFMDHPVPGLLTKLKQRNEKHKEYAERLKKSHAELLTLQANSIDDYKGIYNQLIAWQIEHNSLKNSQLTLWNRLQAYLEHIEGVTNKLLKAYRENNKLKRTSPAPDYFNEPWLFPLVDYQAPINIEANENYSEKIRVALEEITKSESELNAEFHLMSDLLTGIDALLMDVKVKNI